MIVRTAAGRKQANVAVFFLKCHAPPRESTNGGNRSPIINAEGTDLGTRGSG